MVCIPTGQKVKQCKQIQIITDTQEAPKSLTIDSSSSLESLASVENDYPHSDNEICSTPQPTPKAIPKRIPPPFHRTILPQKKLGGAFTSYVRRRGKFTILPQDV